METKFQYPDNAWLDGKIASWEAKRFGYRALREIIVDPANFNEIINSAGDDEIVELFNPTANDKLVLTYLDQDGAPRDGQPIVLDMSHPTVIIPRGTKYIMDATQTTSNMLFYTCICFGEQALIE